MSSALARRLRAVLLAVAGLLGAAGNGLAQNTLTLHGRVRGTDGKPLAAAQLAVLNRETGQQRNAITYGTSFFEVVRRQKHRSPCDR